MRSLVLLIGGLVVLGACRRAPREQLDSATAVPPPATTPAPAGTGAALAPVLAAIVPDSVRLAPNTVSEIALRGSGFSPSGTNTVRVGPVVLGSVSANATGTEIRVVVPTRYSTNNEAPPRPLFPGAYPVTVETGGKTSNSVLLKVMP